MEIPTEDQDGEMSFGNEAIGGTFRGGWNTPGWDVWLYSETCRWEASCMVEYWWILDIVEGRSQVRS